MENPPQDLLDQFQCVIAAEQTGCVKFRAFGPYSSRVVSLPSDTAKQPEFLVYMFEGWELGVQIWWSACGPEIPKMSPRSPNIMEKS